MEITIQISTDSCQELFNSLVQDNDENISMECQNNSIIIKIKNAKLSSIYNLVDDFVRDYETFEKIKNL
ncbi:MAG: KEOPS complex subunit Pcc1 [Ferroplasma sp.]